jgi:hypothetical protein
MTTGPSLLLSTLLPPKSLPAFPKIRTKMRGLFTAVLSVAFALPFAQALPSITRTGKYLYDSSGTRFFIKVGLWLHFYP